MQRLGQVDRRLPAELHDHRWRFPTAGRPAGSRRLVLQDVPHALLVQRLEVEPVEASKSVLTVSGLLLIMMLATPASRSAMRGRTLQ